MSIEDAVREMYRWQFEPTNSFYNRLILCIQMADRENRMKLAVGFPELITAFCLWHQAKDQREFFKEWGFLKDD